MQMHNPPHPGETLREDILPALNLSVTEAAEQLGISRVALSRFLNGHSSASIDLARRLEIWLGGPKKGPSAESWLRQQIQYDLWWANQQGAPDVQPAVA
jgi:addiction module HigA family antidote